MFWLDCGHCDVPQITEVGMTVLEFTEVLLLETVTLPAGIKEDVLQNGRKMSFGQF